MSPLSPGVLGGAAVVASPALAGVLDGTMPLDVALTRYLIAVGICWVVISIVVELAFPAPGTVRPAPVKSEMPAESDSDHAS
ncbi:hypothetical protein [Nocardioides marmorisolisilvae]|uniref:Uncharacterized protein n=1 Tax=Nocardioides marmorisolisilvae TaxID=1542737 RepID=A0A3N0DXB0_9ACTN|nr:hypothetical protein [Nocardioides marmorisolisilvae]RNL80258.1 hypothetical protein EFL95_15295 [Nocardioides marmorisolisilvae]